MTKLDLELDQAAADLWALLDDVNLGRPPSTGPRGPSAPQLVGGLVAAAALATTGALVLRRHVTSDRVVSTEPATAVPASSSTDAPTTVPDPGGLGVDDPAPAELQLASDVAAISAGLGWNVVVPDDLIASTSGPLAIDAQYVEVRVRVGTGSVSVSIATGGPAHFDQRSVGLIRSEGFANAYTQIDSARTRAVELYDGDRVVHVRSDSATAALPIDELASLAFELDRTWATHDPLVVRTAMPLSVESDVAYQQIEMTVTSDLTCDGPMDSAGQFTSAVLEAWSDRSGRRFRNTISYPDGSTAELIAVGSAIYPSEVFVGGSTRNAVIGCTSPNGQTYVLGSMPGGGTSFSSLARSDDLTPAEDQMFSDRYDRSATRVPGEVTDSLGRPAQLWRQTVIGFANYPGDADQMPLTQVTEWYVDPVTGRVLEWRFTHTVDQLGTATVTEVVTADTTIPLDDGLFDTSTLTRAV